MLLRRLIRVCAVVVVVLVAGVSYLQASLTESTFPLGSSANATILFSESVPRDEVARELAELGRREGLGIWLLAPAKDDPTHGLDLYSLGADQPEKATPLAWLTLGRHGSIRPTAELGSTNLNGDYALRGSGEAVAALERWAEAKGATVYPQAGGPVMFFLLALTYGASGAVLVGLAALISALVLAWYAERAQSRAVRVLSGASAWRIQAQDLVGWLGLTAPFALGGLVATAVGVGLAWGWGNALRVASLAGAHLLWLGAFSLLAGVVCSVLTWPRTEAMARREPPSARFEWVGLLAKGLSLAIGLASAPALVLLVSGSLHEADVQSRVAPLRGLVSIRVGGVSMPEFEAKAQDVGQFVADADRAGKVAYAELNTRVGPELRAAGFDSVLLVDRAYLNRLGADGLVPLDDIGAPPDELLGQIRSPGATLAELGVAAHSVSGEPILAPHPSGRGFHAAQRPLVLVADQISRALSDDSLASSLTGGEVMFDSPETVYRHADAHGVRRVVRVVQEVTDVALLAAQDSRQKAVTISATSAVLLAAITVLAWLAANVHAAANARRVFAMRALGNTWWTIFGRRIVVEVALVGVCFAAVSAGYTLAGQPWSAGLLVGVALYLGLSGWLHARAGQTVVDRVATRSN